MPHAGLEIQLITMIVGLYKYWPAHSFAWKEAQGIVKRSLLSHITSRSENSSDEENINDYLVVLMGKLIELGWVSADSYIDSFHVTEEGCVVARLHRPE